jgi:site-specific DNA-methyltransferase (adenine-specific)
MTLPLDSIICGHNVNALRAFPDECIDLTVTSPPYDDLRQYNGYSFDFEAVARELYRITKPGGVVVWVVGEKTVDGDESDAAFEQALFFKSVGFKRSDTMIYEKTTFLPRRAPRYDQAFEYMFVFTKGRPKTVNLLEVPCKNAGRTQTNTARDNHSDSLKKTTRTIKATKPRTNIWKYATGANATTADSFAFAHPAMFPEQLAEDHILSWSNAGDIVLDPFGGSGTVAKMAKKNGRHFVHIDVSDEYCEIARRRVQTA